jgi:hypothetical protein
MEVLNDDNLFWEKEYFIENIVWFIHILCFDAIELPNELIQRHELTMLNTFLINNCFDYFFSQQKWEQLA